MTTTKKLELDPATALDSYQWLVNQSGSQLQGYAGGTIHDPQPTTGLVDQLRQISERAAALADYYDSQDIVDDPSVTPFDQLPEEAQKAVKEQQKQIKENEKLYEAQGLNPEVPVADPQPPESKEAKVTSPDTRASEGLTTAQAQARQEAAKKS